MTRTERMQEWAVVWRLQLIPGVHKNGTLRGVWTTVPRTDTGAPRRKGEGVRDNPA